LALGHADEPPPINSWRSPRESLDGFATLPEFAGRPDRPVQAMFTPQTVDRRMPHSRMTALLVALLVAPAALAADSPVPGTVPAADSAPAAAPAQAATPAATVPAAPAPAQAAQPPGTKASAAVPPPHQAHIPPHRLACLTKSEQRIAVAQHQAISLGEAIKSVRRHGKRAEVVRARLCHRGEKLAYVLTLFGHSGRVFEVSVDAVSGDLMASR
jgi:hypothetical protein